MKKNLIKYIFIFVAIIVIMATIIIIYFYSNYSEDATSTQDKIKQEIEYLDGKLVSVINSLNNLDTEYLLTNNDINLSLQNQENSQEDGNSSESQSNNITSITTVNPKSILTRNRDDVDWEYINTSLEEISNSWAVINIDLNSINVPNDELLSFRDNMDLALKYANANDKINSLISVANIYSMIPIYENSNSNNTEDIEFKYIKSDILSSYALLDTDRWNEILELLNDADTRMSKMISLNGNNQNIQKIYVELKEYIKSVNDKDIDICYMKYYYLIKDIESENNKRY